MRGAPLELDPRRSPMNFKHWLCASVVLAVAVACQSTSSNGSSANPPSQEEMNARWTAYATPGAPHDALKQKVGKWSLTVKMFVPGEAAPMESTGTSEMKLAMDGRYLLDTTEGEAMGAPFKGVGTTGYDNLKKKYVATWIDNMGTGVSFAEGTYDAAKKMFSYKCQMPDVMAGKWIQGRSTEQMTDANHWTMRAYQPGADGKEYMSMQIDYTRVH
jgi:hypothetical protein